MSDTLFYILFNGLWIIVGCVLYYCTVEIDASQSKVNWKSFGKYFFGNRGLLGSMFLTIGIIGIVRLFISRNAHPIMLIVMILFVIAITCIIELLLRIIKKKAKKL